MRDKLLLIFCAVGVLALALLFAQSPADAAGDGKNLKVLSKSLSKKEIRTIMKNMSKAVGKSCDECHELTDFAKDTKMKEKGRQMFRLTNSINSRLKKDGFKKRVQCVTCHAGEAVPK